MTSFLIKLTASGEVFVDFYSQAHAAKSHVPTHAVDHDYSSQPGCLSLDTPQSILFSISETRFSNYINSYPPPPLR